MTAEILAILAAGPHDQDHLVKLLGCLPAALRAALRHLKAAGQIKRTGVKAKWALAAYTAKAGRRLDPDPPDLAEQIAAFLTDGPKSAVSIGTAFGWSKTTTQRRLTDLSRQRAIKLVGRGRMALWALPSYVPPPVIPKAIPFTFGRPPVHVATALRQAGPSATIAKDADPSWWVGEPQDGFTDVATAQFDRMRTSKEHFRIGFRILQ